MGHLRQRIRFCESPGGVRIAYSVIGKGPPLVMLSGGHSHLELDPGSPVFGHWIEALASRHSLVRLDTRGFGLSDRGIEDHSIEAVIGDVRSVVQALGLERFALLAWLGGTPFAVTYAERFPGTVTHLVLHAAYLRGWLKRGIGAQERSAVDALVKQVESGWDMADPIVRHAITSSFIPDSSASDQAWLNEALREGARGEDAARRLATRLQSDVTALASRLACPTLVLNSEKDTNPPFAEGRLAASLIPGARFVALASRNHVLLAHERAWRRWLEEAGAFLGQPAAAGSAFAALSPREIELAALIAEGLDNSQIAARLSISEKTVRNHITRIFAKLGVATRAQAIVLSHRSGLGRRSHETC
ncbi:MAG TPA: alpha/beta fold hydrolase [Usitatibacter sp.]|nr:alpha/beta fold hydrolase [Usitatibacter sp.]